MQRFHFRLSALYHILLGLVCIFFLSCGTDSSPKKSESTTPVEQQEESTTNEEEENERDYWQKPDLVLAKLGNVEDKVIVDIGAGIGYFAFPLARKKTKKVIAVDIDPKMIDHLNFFKLMMMERDSTFDQRFEARLAEPNDPLLAEEEADIILIVNTSTYFEDRIAYFSSLKNKLKENGKLVIVDFKAKRLDSEINPPQFEDRIPLYQMEKDLESAGYDSYTSDDTSLEFQYIVVAQK